MIRVDLGVASTARNLPSEQEMQRWAEAAAKRDGAEVAIRIVDEAESAQLNERFRRKSGPTNVLSFPFEVPPGVPNDLLGDIVICAPVVQREADEQGKPRDAHWAHMVVHGMLHLQGFDHVEESDAVIMEAQEIAILGRLGFPNPYEEGLPS